MFSGSRHEFYLKNMLSWIIIGFIVTVMHAKSHLYTENILFLVSYMDWAECLDKTFRKLQDMIKLPWVLSKCLPPGSPLQDWCTHSPAAQSYWLLTTKARSLARTWPWLKGFCIPGQRSFPRAAWILWLVNVGLQRPDLLPSIQGHFEGSSQSQNSPNKIIEEGLCCNRIPVQLLPLPGSAFLFSYRLCSKCAVQQTPCIPIPISESFQETWPKTDSFILFATSYEDTKPFWYFPSCNFYQSISQSTSIDSLVKKTTKQNGKYLWLSNYLFFCFFPEFSIEIYN